jgi:uncharacterized protein with PIN domain
VLNLRTAPKSTVGGRVLTYSVPAGRSFAADRMLGRLAKMLRLLGYDTLYSSDMSVERLLKAAADRGRMVLTRGQAEKRFPGVNNVYSVRSEHPPEQLREVVRRFDLDTRSGLWTRCTLCNGTIERAEKASVKTQVGPRIFELYNEFFRCQSCGHIYWKGSHADRILRKLASLLA